MKITQRPIRTTVFYGLICGFAFIPLSTGLCYIFPWAPAFSIIVWLYLAVYGFLMTRWASKSPLSILFPLLILLISVFMVSSTSAFLFLALGIFSWIRSGICFQQPLPRVFGAELLLTLGGAGLVAWFTPYSTFTWALGIWMFFLVQSLYFLMFEDRSLGEKITVDPFEAALLQAEKVISARL